MEAREPQKPADPSLHGWQVRRMLWVCAGIFLIQGVGWGMYFFFSGHAFLVALDLLMFLVGFAIVWMTERGQVRPAFYVFVIAAWLYIFGLSWFFDVPSPDAPRSIHYYLVPVSAATMLFLRNERALLRHGMTGVSLVLFVVLGSLTSGYGPEYTLPDTIRASGTWINISSASVALFIVIRLMVTEIQERSVMEQDLRHALEGGELFLVYQPQVDVHGHVHGAEALLRWRHPRHGLIPPGSFIATAERSGLITEIGDWVLQQACLQLAAWQRAPELEPITVAVNVSAIQFAQPDYVQKVFDEIERSGADPTRLKLELTESALARDIDGIVRKMKALRTLGVELSLDDFGTGFSSLTYLRRLPLQQLKIDQSFVRDLLDDPHDAAIVQTVIDLCHTLGFTALAEGVETDGQRQALAARGCALFQGYLFSVPLSAEEFETYVRSHASADPRHA